MHKVKPEIFDLKTEKKLRGSVAVDGTELQARRTQCTRVRVRKYIMKQLQAALDLAETHFSVPPLLGMSSPDSPDVRPHCFF